MIVHDAVAPVSAGTGDPNAAPCVAVDPHTVSCPTAPSGDFFFGAFVARLGDADDTIQFATAELFPGESHLVHYVQIFGGAGADRLRGSSARDFVNPGSGRDTVATLGAGDVVRSVDGERDVVDGGGGFNRATADRVDVLRHFVKVKRR